MQINISFAQSWNELEPNQLKKICHYFNKGYKGKRLQLLLFFTLLNTKWYQLKKSYHAMVVLKNVPLSELAKHYSYIFTKSDLTKFIPKIKHFHAPANRLGNITIDELAHADDAYLKYLATNNIEYLRVLTAVLYRETKGYGKREPFIKEELTARIEAFKKVDTPTLLAVMRSFQGCRNHITQQFKKVFPKPKQGAANKNKKPPKSSQFSKIILELTGGKFGTYKETAQTNAYTFLANFQNQIIAQAKTPKK